MLELFNVNNYAIEVPKFNYNGKYVIPGKSFVDIEEHTASFYRPYSVIGAVVRNKVEVIDVKEEEFSIDSRDEEISVDVETSPVVDDVPVAYQKIKLDDVDVEEVVEEEPLYTEESLRFKGLYELKEIAESMGIEVNTRKKEDIRKMILDKC